MEWYRILNFILQGIYLPIHLVFIVSLIKNRKPTPIWHFFIVVVIGLWIMVSGRFLETIAYIFYPNNDFYVFAVYYQLVGTTFASFAFLLWNLYLARCDKLANKPIFRIVLFSVATIISIFVCTNSLHHLFYEKLVMGEQVQHGKLFYLCLVLVYAALFIGYIISIIHIIRKEKNKAIKIIVFSLYPLLPAVTALVRSITGVDELDFTPIIMFVAVFCLYIIVFKFNSLSLISKSIESVLEEIPNIVVLYNPQKGILYQNNKEKKELVDKAIEEVNKQNNVKSFELVFYDSHFYIEINKDDDNELIIINNIDDVYLERKAIEESIVEAEKLINDLNEKKNTIQTYINALYDLPDLKEKVTSLTNAQKIVLSNIAIIKEHFIVIKNNPKNSEALLKETATLCQETIMIIRKAVNKLSGVSANE